MVKYVIMNNTGKAVQSWTFGDKPHVIYCKSIDWALKSSDRTVLERRLEFLNKNFPGQNLRILKVTIETNVTVG